MIVAGAKWRKRVERIFPSVSLVDHSWLPSATRHTRSVLRAAASHPVAARVLRRRLPPDQDMLAVDPREMQSLPNWADWSAGAQRHLIRRLGAIGCAPYLRLLINKSELDIVRQSIDADVLREALRAEKRLLATEIGKEFDVALQANDLGAFVAAVGLGIVRATIPERQRFLLFRLKYLFPQLAWRASLPALRCNQEELLLLLESGPETA